MFFRLFILGVLALGLASCSSTAQLFENEQAAAPAPVILRQYFQAREPVIKPGDKLAISIWGHEDLSVGSVNSVYNSNEATGKWLVVDNDGEVNLPQIGRVKVGGLDMKEVNYQLATKYSRLIKEPIVNVKVLNHYVTVLGEVNAPGKYALDNEQLTLVQLIGEARGLSAYAKADYVRVIRTVNKQPVELKVDLTDIAAVSEYNVVLQPDDIVYVGATRKKDADARLRRATTVSGILTGLAVVASIFIR